MSCRNADVIHIAAYPQYFTYAEDWDDRGGAFAGISVTDKEQWELFWIHLIASAKSVMNIVIMMETSVSIPRHQVTFLTIPIPPPSLITLYAQQHYTKGRK